MKGNLVSIIWVEIGSLKILIYQKINIKNLFYIILCLLQIYNFQKSIDFAMNDSRCGVVVGIGPCAEEIRLQSGIELFWFNEMTSIDFFQPKKHDVKFSLFMKSLCF